MEGPVPNETNTDFRYGLGCSHKSPTHIWKQIAVKQIYLWFVGSFHLVEGHESVLVISLLCWKLLLLWQSFFST